MDATLIAVIVQTIFFVGITHFHRKQWLTHIKEKEVEWNKERQYLLDRIMAPSFDHLKQAEVRVIKAQKEDKPLPPVELL